MTHRIRDLAEQIVHLQSELDREIESRRKQLGWNLKEGLLRFEHGIVAEHRRLKVGATKYLARSNWTTILTAPVIYANIIPLLLLDGCMSLYQAICFPAYRIPRVTRADYLRFDRDHLAYLNWIEALNCRYCSYANGLIAYVREIASRTEQYWCPIKHALRIPDPHQRYHSFLEYGDAEGYRARLDELRAALRDDDQSAKNA
jgi:hypothetical protein